MLVAVLALAGCETLHEAASASAVRRAAAPAEEPSPAGDPVLVDDPIGVWNVVWDRSGTGWKPTKFHGTLVIGGDGTVGLDWTEATGDPELSILRLEGRSLHIEWVWPTVPDGLTILDATVDGEDLTGQMTTTDGSGRTVPWSAVHGRRVPTLAVAP